MSDHREKGHRSHEEDGHPAGPHESGHHGPQGGLRNAVKTRIKAALGMHGGHESHGSHGEHHGHGPKKGFLDRVLSRLRRGPSRH